MFVICEYLILEPFVGGYPPNFPALFTNGNPASRAPSPQGFRQVRFLSDPVHCRRTSPACQQRTWQIQYRREEEGVLNGEGILSWVKILVGMWAREGFRKYVKWVLPCIGRSSYWQENQTFVNFYSRGKISKDRRLPHERSSHLSECQGGKKECVCFETISLMLGLSLPIKSNFDSRSSKQCFRYLLCSLS